MTTRWFVEVSPIDADTLKERYCVEAAQWQQALQQARKIRGDRGPLSRFAIELLDTGYRATDPQARLRYTVGRAATDESLSGGAPEVAPAAPVASAPAVAAPEPAPAAAPAQPQPGAALPQPPQSAVPRAAPRAPVAPVSAAPRPVAAASIVPAIPRVVLAAPTAPASAPTAVAVAPTAPVAAAVAPTAVVVAPTAPRAPAAPAAAVVAPTAPASAPTAAAVAPTAPTAPAVAPTAVAPKEAAPEAVPSLPGLELIMMRKEEPTEAVPITYREYAFAVAEGLSPKDLERYAKATWEQVRTAIGHRTSGKFVQIALFDHRFSGRPLRPPVAALAWKDWRGDPVLQIRGAEAAPAAPGAASVAAVPQAAPPAAPGFPAPAHGAPVVPPSAAAPAPVAPAAPAAAPMAAVAQPAAAQPAARPAAGMASRDLPEHPAPRRRGPAEDLIGELFEEMHQLHFMPDIVTGAEYVLNVLTRTMPCDGVIVHVFDINKRQFVAVRAAGPRSASVLLYRTPDTFALFRDAFRRMSAVSFQVVPADESYAGGRWERLGVTPQAALCGAVKQGGRYLGVIELANPLGGGAFHSGEVNALDYICEQFADFVASRPIVIDDDAVVPRT